MKDIVVIIEDENDLLELMEFHLSRAGYDVVGFLDTKGARNFLEEEEVSLMIVDRNLKGVEGSEFVRDLRRENINIPVIFATAKDSDREVEEGFVRGGDDYIKKPFNMNELVLRAKAIIVRTSNKQNILRIRDITLNTESREVFVDNKKIELTKLEFNLLEIFMRNKNRALDRDYLLREIWRDEAEYNSNTVTVSIGRLIKKIDPQKRKNYIKSVRQIGYMLCGD
ncbi:MAG: response regulator transcription factor [Helicobacteraceae bacterium]|jgi:DNA-binding response OmpR family regulator|nr:response regulator transcription factor [Helicobacteraceae bacterium]